MASMTIDTPTGEDSRIQAAFGRYLGLSGSATGTQIKNATINWMKSVVRDQERAVASQTAIAGVVDVNPT